MTKSKICFSLLLWIAAALPAFAAPPVVTLSNEALTVTITPGSSLALLSVAREPDYYMSRLVVRQELLVDDDGDGQVRYAVPKGIAFRSIWIVVNVATGEYTMATPEGFQPLEMRQRGAGRGKAVEAIANTLDIGRTSVALLLVRPGEGAWAAHAGEGTTLDVDKKNDRRMRMDLSAMRRLGGGSEQVHALRRGDIVAVLDPALTQYWIARIE